MTTDDKREYCYKSVTLNGVRAVVRGALLDFGLVWQLDAPYLKCEYSWPTIDRVISKGGAFKS